MTGFSLRRFWRLSLPLGADTDHSFSNPFGPASTSLESVSLDPILVVIGGADLLRDRAREYTEKLKAWGKRVELAEFEGEQHGFYTIDPFSKASDELMRLIQRFITDNSS